MNDRVAMLTIRDVLRTNLEDPLYQYTNKNRQFIHTDVELPTATYPRIQLEKPAETTIQNISIGFNYWEDRTLPIDIWFKTKTNFKYTDNGTILQNEELVKEYLEKIVQVLKTKHKQVNSEHGIYIKLVSIGEPKQDEEFQLYYGRVRINVIYFKNDCS